MFDADLFADPAWDILLALFCSHLADRQMTLQDAIKSAAVPESTARRWLTALERRGLIRSVAHEDRVQLTPSAISKLEAYVERLRKKSLMRVI
jgi:DNA-binding IclR family transcriptional regulator